MNRSPTSRGGDLSSVVEALGQLIDQSSEGISSSPQAAKSCCASLYGLDLVGLFLGDSYHPGGAGLTRRLADILDLQPGQEMLDVACGVGTTALLLAAERGVNITGIDLGAAQVAQARIRASRLGLDNLARFELGDAERLPFDDGVFDAVICECALCTFPDKATAAREMARVLRRGGRIGITDVWLELDRLYPELAGVAGRIACLADAQPISVTCDLLVSSGLEVIAVERHDQALADTIEQILLRLRAVKIVGLPGLDSGTLDRAISLAGKADAVVARGDAGYLLMTAEKTS